MSFSHSRPFIRADGVYMGFPFIAAYGAVTHNQTLLKEAYTQCKLYRNALLQPGPTGPLWAHIVADNGTFIDPGLWGTGLCLLFSYVAADGVAQNTPFRIGNAWAALGMLRVQATLIKSSFASTFSTEISDLSYWIKEILDGTFKALVRFSFSFSGRGGGEGG